MVRAAPPCSLRSTPRPRGRAGPGSRAPAAVSGTGSAAPRAAGTAFNTGHVARRTSPSNGQWAARARRIPAGSRDGKGAGRGCERPRGCALLGAARRHESPRHRCQGLLRTRRAAHAVDPLCRRRPSPTGRPDCHQRAHGSAARARRYAALCPVCAPARPATPGKGPRRPSSLSSILARARLAARAVRKASGARGCGSRVGGASRVSGPWGISCVGEPLPVPF